MFDLRVWRRYWCRWDVTAHPKPPAVSGAAPWADDWGDLLREEEDFLELLAAPAGQLRGATPPAPPGDASPPPPPKPARFTPIGAASDSARSLSPVATPSLKAPSSSVLHPLRSAQSFRVDGGAAVDEDEDDEGDAY